MSQKLPFQICVAALLMIRSVFAKSEYCLLFFDISVTILIDWRW